MKLRPSAKPVAKLVDPSRQARKTGGARAGDGASATAPARSAASPRPVIRGESGQREAQTIVDWLSFTFLPDGSIGDALEQLRKYFHLWFAISVTLMPSKKRAGLRGYEASTDVLAWVNGETMRLATIGCGGDNVGGTMMVDMSGQGCVVVADWDAVYATVQDLDANITRCDLARDFCEGQVSVDQVEQMYFAGEFNAGGRIPKYKKIESGIAGCGAIGGRTLEIGKRVNGKMLRAYEKGRQLGKQDSEWLRIEIEFRNKDRVVDHRILIERDRYFVGAYKALEQLVEADPLKCATDQKEAIQLQDEIVIERKLDHLQVQFGKLVDYRMHTTEENAAAFVIRIRRPGVPAQLHKSALARHVYGAHDPAPTVGS
ncbi:replication initiation factor domain-containing protein [Cupriavidus sp. CuC1]|uniref:replication initiation factor domain-containing protein n=1 Tax=Cupriavidus sp. CuC1 TaxID=3373131 RepID=UPI0037D1B584